MRLSLNRIRFSRLYTFDSLSVCVRNKSHGSAFADWYVCSPHIFVIGPRVFMSACSAVCSWICSRRLFNFWWFFFVLFDVRQIPDRYMWSLPNAAYCDVFVVKIYKRLQCIGCWLPKTWSACYRHAKSFSGYCLSNFFLVCTYVSYF